MVDRNTGRGGGLVKAGMGVLAVTAQLQMTVIRDKQSIRPHFTGSTVWLPKM